MKMAEDPKQTEKDSKEGGGIEDLPRGHNTIVGEGGFGRPVVEIVFGVVAVVEGCGCFLSVYEIQ